MEFDDMKLTEYMQEKEFSASYANAFPEGKTVLDVSKIEVEETKVDYGDGQGAKTRWILKEGNKEFWAGIKVMKGIKKAIEEGASFVEINRAGTTKADTTYIVSAVDAPEKK